MIGSMSNEEFADFANLAVQLAQEVTKTVLDRLGTRAISRKVDHSLVTDADEAAQSHILSAVADRFPTHAFLA